MVNTQTNISRSKERRDRVTCNQWKINNTAMNINNIDAGSLFLLLRWYIDSIYHRKSKSSLWVPHIVFQRVKKPENKSCLNELKFFEVSQTAKSNI